MFPLRDSAPSRIFPFVTWGLIAINVYVFFLEITSPSPDEYILTYALIPSRVDFGDIESLLPFITSQFLHGGFLHILSNMWFLKIFGDNVEERLGGFLFLSIYLFSGIVGGLLQYIFLPNSDIPMLGASGAVAGVLGMYFVFFPHHKIETLIPLGFFITTADIPASVMLVYWFLTQFFAGVGSIAETQLGGVAFWAHVGGFVTGYLIAKISDSTSDKDRESGMLDI